jgi:uncharacterized membrane protein YhiD involved in acid resistance
METIKMVHTAIIAVILILIMFFLTSGEKKKHMEEVSKPSQEVTLDAKDTNEQHALLKTSSKKEEAEKAVAEVKVDIDKIAIEMKVAAEVKAKEEADKDAAEAKAKEEADKVAADAKAKE